MFKKELYVTVELPIIEDENNIETTEEELNGYYIVKSIVRSKISASRLSYKDSINYFSINIDEKVKKSLCRSSMV